KIAIDEPSIDETVRILAGLRGRYEAHHRVKYTDAALDAAARLASRHLRDYRLPDSAIDLLDEAGAVTRLKAPIPETVENSANLENLANPANLPNLPNPANLPNLPNPPNPLNPPNPPNPVPVVDASDIEPIVARMARIPARQASSSDRERLRT